jgi:hypothetical protein
MSTLLEIAQEHYAKPRVLVDDWAAWRRDEMPKLDGYAGMHSFATLGRHSVRYCDARVSTTIAGVEFPGMWEGELRRPYVSACMGGVRSLWSRTDEDAMREIVGIEIPHYCRGGEPDEPMVGIDLNNAYFSIAQHFSTQVEYRADSGLWTPAGNPWQDIAELNRHKQLRTVICSRGWRTKTTSIWRHGEAVERRNAVHYQPQAWRLLSDYLHAIAQEAIGLFGAWAVLTDEYLVPASRGDELRVFLAQRWGLASKVHRTWEPGEPWPWARARGTVCHVRSQDDAKRQRLAWALADNGPSEPCLVASSEDDVRRGDMSRSAPVAPARLDFHVRHRLEPDRDLVCARVGPPPQRVPAKWAPVLGGYERGEGTTEIYLGQVLLTAVKRAGP